VALFVEFEEAGEDFISELVGPAEAPGLFLFGFLSCLFFLFLIVEEELARGSIGQVSPTIGF